MSTKLKTVDIKGKAYVEVNQRIKYFRETYEDGAIITNIVSHIEGVCVIKAEVYVNGTLTATGHAYEKEGSTFINKTSYIENCETSAIGRALGILGIGIDTSVASYEEVGNAVKQQEAPKQENKPRYTNEQDAITKETQKGLASLLGSLSKPENVEHKDAVVKSVCGICEVKDWNDITFTGNLTYKKLIEIVKQELQKEKDLKELGV